MQELLNNFFKLCSFINDNLGVLLVLVTTLAALIEKSQTAFKPISKFLRWLNRMSNKEVLDEIKEVKKDVDTLKSSIVKINDKVDDNERDRIRNEILQFGNALRDGKKFSKDAFQHIRDIYQKYHEDLHGNGMITDEFNYIMSVYNSTKFH